MRWLAVLLLAVSPALALEPQVPPLPDGLPAFGEKDVAAVWLVLPTDRYGHGVLGDAIEAGGLEVLAADGSRVHFTLPEERVFEDLRPRLADLDGDGRDEILVVESDREKGARLSVYGLDGASLVLRAATPFIGQSHRWLNPAAIADLSPEPGLEVALVDRPHLVGLLKLWSYDPASGELLLLSEQSGFSNHSAGSRSLGLSAVVPDQDGDGYADLLLPRSGRQALALVSFADGEQRVLWLKNLKAPISQDFLWQDDVVQVEDESGTTWSKDFR